jgi:chromosome partitioning protein
LNTGKNAEIIVVTNQKGGVGKSTTSEALAAGLSIRGYKTLLIDLDPQGSVSLSSGVNENLPNAYDLLTGTVNPQEAAQHNTQDNTQKDTHDNTHDNTQDNTQEDTQQRPWIIPAGKDLARLDAELNMTGKEYRLKERIRALAPEYDYIVIDTPPALGILTINALTAADSLVIPANADLYSLQGIGQLYETIQAVKTYTNPGLVVKGVLLTRHSPRNILSRDMAEAARRTAEQIGTFLYDAVIRESVAVKEAQASQQSIFGYAPKSNAGVDYMGFVDEFIERGKPHAKE